MKESIYTKIINREIPGHFIHEDEHCVAILDRFPAVKGQVLVIPKAQVDYVFDLASDTYDHLFRVTKTVARACDSALDAARTCIVVEGLDVPHVHIKIYPLPNTDRPLGEIMPEGVEATDEDLALVATQISAALAKE